MNSTRREQFSDLIARHQSQIFGFVRALVRSNHDAQDIHQQTLVVLWRKFHQFELGTNFLAWAIRVAKMEVQQFYRAQQKQGGVFAADVLSDLAQAMENDIREGVVDEQKEALEKCLSKLSVPDHDLIIEVYLSEQKIKDVAEKLGRIPQSVSNSLRRIRHQLFECIERTLSRSPSDVTST